MRIFFHRKSVFSRLESTLAAIYGLRRSIYPHISYAEMEHPGSISISARVSNSRFGFRVADAVMSVSRQLRRRSERGPPFGLAVLVAEDDPVNQLLFGIMLQRLGHRADVVRNGLMAVEACRERTYDVVLMDMDMPGLSGSAATRAIRSAGGIYAKLPIVALTADDLAERRRFLDGVGFTQVMTKPINQDQLGILLDSVSESPASVMPEGIKADRAL